MFSLLFSQRGATDIQLQSRLNAFCQQIQSVGQRLQTLTIKQRDHNAGVTDSGEGSEEEAGEGRAAIEALLAELQALQKKMAAGEQVGGVINLVYYAQPTITVTLGQ